MSQRGQATPEYVAVVLLVALILGAAGVVVSDPGLGRSLLQAMRRALCIVSGYGCDRDHASRACWRAAASASARR